MKGKFKCIISPHVDYSKLCGANVTSLFCKLKRTFLAWLHVVVMLGGASVTIVTFSSGQGIVEQLFGIILLPVSIAYIFYALSQCKSVMLNFEDLRCCIVHIKAN